MEEIKHGNLIVEKSGEIAIVKINRPKKYNALSFSLLQDLKKLNEDLRTDLRTRVVILTGEGKAFCAGIDVSKEGRDQWFQNPQPNERLYQRNGQEIMRGLGNLDQITIAAINGLCIGAGVCIATNCDFRIVSEKAYFSIPETALGFIYSLSCSYSLLALVGPSKTKRMILACDKVSSQEALAMGLADKVVPQEQLMDAAMEMAGKIISKAPTANRINKKMINAASVERMYTWCLCEAELVAGAQANARELEEGLQAFWEKRQPNFPREI